ncbi:hypothetical protein Tsubulata_022487 [Turnera subulata]|uniref:Copper transport protein n=1 Tax=Turnera subulata TaxID=218843 RepID=A0A9Q0FNH1_9ROSI|nr:hypothetical protein Tsubulata_022487 [Turnera subulata]
MSHSGHGEGDMPMTPGGSMDGNMNMSMSPSDMMMHMSFYWGKDAIILFSGWPNDSLGMYILAIFTVLLLAAAIEVFSASPGAVLGNNTNSLVGVFIQACIYAVRMAFAYLVMLSVMSYNLGIFIAAVAGHTIGFFLVKVRAFAATTAHGTAQNGVDPKV